MDDTDVAATKAKIMRRQENMGKRRLLAHGKILDTDDEEKHHTHKTAK